MTMKMKKHLKMTNNSKKVCTFAQKLQTTMKYSKNPKDDSKIIKALSREDELIRNDGKWVAITRAFKNKKKYNRKDKKRELRKDLGSYFFTDIALSATRPISSLPTCSRQRVLPIFC